jgi:hypothetical protein
VPVSVWWSWRAVFGHMSSSEKKPTGTRPRPPRTSGSLWVDIFDHLLFRRASFSVFKEDFNEEVLLEVLSKILKTLTFSFTGDYGPAQRLLPCPHTWTKRSEGRRQDRRATGPDPAEEDPPPGASKIRVHLPFDVDLPAHCQLPSSPRASGAVIRRASLRAPRRVRERRRH